jgi:SAM-dependent methyltransferase
MTPEQREAIRSNAKYLKHVRPINPDEIHEYVEPQPHPSAVRQVLRESAVDLGLIERDDGTFVPVEDSPIAPDGIVSRFPEPYANLLLDRLVDRYGVDWSSDESGHQLRSVISELKADYFEGTSVSYHEDAAFGYAIYHLPATYASLWYVIDELARSSLLPRQLRVLDVGAGVGGPALALYDFLSDEALVDYHALEPSAAADLLESMLEETGPNFHTTIHRTTAEAFDPTGEFDLLCFVNVLNELDRPVETVRRYGESLEEDGTIVVIEPADRETSIGLRQTERAVVDELTVFSPTIRLWPGMEPESRCWSFDVKPDLMIPEFQRRLESSGDGTGEFVNVDVQFSYALLRRDGTRRIEYVPDPDRFAKMAATDRHVTDRIDLVAIKLSHDLSDEGHPLFLIGDGSERVDHFAVLTKETSLNRGLEGANYGSLLVLQNVLVLWNDDEGAYNVIVDAETTVDAVR